MMIGNGGYFEMAGGTISGNTVAGKEAESMNLEVVPPA